MEASVVNVEDVDNFCAHFAAKVESPEAKAWFAKKLRREIINDTTGKYLHRANPNRMPEPQPEWLKATIERGEDVFEFTPSMDIDEVNHIVDFFQSLEKSSSYHGEVQVQVEDAAVARKLLSKLSKMGHEQINHAADEWFTRMGHRALTGTKAGVEIVHTWSDGYYAVRYTDVNTMMRDGAELQNCLATGTYWAAVESGQQSVYGIRTPSHEAVVGIRVENSEPPRLHECKGKANKSPNPEYLPYCTQFLTALGTTNNILDLRNVGIMCGKGGYGTFEEVAVPEKIGRFDALIVDDMIELSYKGTKIGVSKMRSVTKIPMAEIREIPKRDLIVLLNGLTERGFHEIEITTATSRLSTTTHILLKQLGIYFVVADPNGSFYDRARRYGTFDEVARKYKTPFGEVFIACGWAMCRVGGKKVMVQLKARDGYYADKPDRLLPSMTNVELPRDAISSLNSKQLAEVLNRFRHLKFKNGIENPEVAGLSLDKVGSKKVYSPYVEKLAAVCRDTEMGHLVYRFPKKGPAEKVVLATKTGWREFPIEKGQMSMRLLVGNTMRDGHSMLISMDTLQTIFRKLKIAPKDQDGYLAASGKFYDEKSKNLIDIETLPVLGDTDIVEVHKSHNANEWFFKTQKDAREGRYGVLKISEEYNGGVYRFFGNGWNGSVHIFQHINEFDPLPKAGFYNFGGMTEYTGMMDTETGFASTPDDIAAQLEKITTFMPDARGWVTHEKKAESLASKAFMHRDLSDAEQMLLVNAMTKNIIATSNHGGSKGYMISPYAIAFANSGSKINGKALAILRKRIDMALDKADEMGLGQTALPEKLRPSWHDQRKAA